MGGYYTGLKVICPGTGVQHGTRAYGIASLVFEEYKNLNLNRCMTLQNCSPRHHICQLPTLRPLPRLRPLLYQHRRRLYHLNEELLGQDHLDVHRGHRSPSVLRVRPHHRNLQDLVGQDTRGAFQVHSMKPGLLTIMVTTIILKSTS